MPALDACEPPIIRALEKDGWRIFKKPHPIKTKRRTVFADFSLRRQRGGRTETVLVVEVKCFADEDNDLTELYVAVGQCALYQQVLSKRRTVYPLYLAMPTAPYERFTQDPYLLDTLTSGGVKLIIVDLAQEVVVKWHR